MFITIIDDDKAFSNIFKKELLKLYPLSQIEIFSDLSPIIYEKECDIFFLDVMFGDKQSFEYGKKILDIFPKTTLVYISSLNDFVYDSYRQNSFFFIRKSQLKKDLIDFNEKYAHLKKRHSSTMTIRSYNQVIEILQCEILYITSDRNQITIFTDFREYTMYLSLKKTLERLDSFQFYRLNSYTIINFDHVKHFDHEGIQMSNDVLIPFTRSNVIAFTNTYLKYRSDKIWNG